MDWTSHHMERIPESGTLKMYELASRLEAEGKTVYHFEVGQPDFPTPPNIVEAAIQALKDGETRYTSSRGIPKLLDAIQSHYSKRGIEIAPIIGRIQARNGPGYFIMVSRGDIAATGSITHVLPSYLLPFSTSS